MSTATDSASAPLRAALYARASKDRSKRGRSVEDQMIENRRVCAANGWTIVDEYPDIDRSAGPTARKTREHYERLKSDVSAGRIDIIVAWESSRLARDAGEHAVLRSLCEQKRVRWCISGQIQDPSKRSDRLASTIMAAVSEDELHGSRERNTRTARLNAERGGPHGRIPFGYVRRYDPEDGHLIGQFPSPADASIVQDLFLRIASRHSVTATAEELMKYLPDGTDLDTARARLRNMLKNRAYIGQRSHKGTYTQAQWDPIVNEDVFWEVQSILGEPGRRTQRDVAATYLLSGIAECEVCTPEDQGQGLRILSMGTKNPRRVTQYACRAATHVTVPQDALDAYVEEALLSWLTTPDAARILAVRDNSQMDAARARAAAARAQLAEARKLATEFDANTMLPKLSALSLASMEANLQPVIDAAEAEVLRLASVQDPIVGRLVGSPADEVEAAWEALTMAQRRHAVRHLVWVRVSRSRGKGVKDGLTSDRVKLLFATEEGFRPKPLRSKAMRSERVRVV